MAMGWTHSHHKESDTTEWVTCHTHTHTHACVRVRAHTQTNTHTHTPSFILLSFLKPPLWLGWDLYCSLPPLPKWSMCFYGFYAFVEAVLPTNNPPLFFPRRSLSLSLTFTFPMKNFISPLNCSILSCKINPESSHNVYWNYSLKLC